MISKAEAKALVAKAQGWFTGLNISPVKQDLWAEALTDEHDLEVDDVTVALKRLAKAPRDGYWRLEIAEIIETSKKVMRERRQLIAQANTPQLPVQAAGLDPGRHERTAAAARAARDLVESLARKKAMPRPDATPAPVRDRIGHETQTPREAEERIRLLHEQGERLMREAEGEAAK